MITIPLSKHEHHPSEEIYKGIQRWLARPENIHYSELIRNIYAKYPSGADRYSPVKRVAYDVCVAMETNKWLSQETQEYWGGDIVRIFYDAICDYALDGN